MKNQTLMQYFEWYLPDDGQHWNRLAMDAPNLAAKGVKKIWMPPAFKATGSNDVGYGIYDLFDLGEFDQKGAIRTKYGFKDEYLQAIQTLKDNGIEPIADVVLNHKAAADGTETFTVIEVDPNDRTTAISEPFTIKGWTHFTFPGRNKQYNDFEWHWYHFTGTDFDAKSRRSGIYLIQGDNKGWANDELVDSENGNYDYLMYADLDFKHPDVIKNLYDWARWFIETTGIQGFRLDAVKHIDSFFMANFIRDILQEYGDDFYVFGEFWNNDEAANNDYLENHDIFFDYMYKLIDDLRTFVTKNDKKNILSFSTIIDSHTNISTPSKEEFLDCVYKVFNFLRALYENDNAKLLLDNIYPILVKSFFAPLRNDDKIKYDYNQSFIYALEYTQIIIEVMDDNHE